MMLESFVIPGVELARARGVDLRGAGFAPVPTPRHAAVLILIGELPPGLVPAVVIAYAQMPRPRAILSVEAGTPTGLPPPDAVASTHPEELRKAHRALQRALEKNERPAFQHPALSPKPAPGDHGENSDQGGDGGGSGDHEGEAGSDGGGMMSMSEMTAGIPRGDDGLPMERLELPFGPLFPGTPSGLELAFVLDGDVVVEAKTQPGLLRRDLLRSALATELPQVLERVDPLVPRTYRALAERALAAVAGIQNPRRDRAEVRSLELERIVSHLNCALGLADLLGLEYLAREGEHLFPRILALHDVADPRALGNLRRWLTRFRRTPGLRRRLAGVAVLGEEVRGVFGPLLRARGVAEDVRASDPVYRELRFSVVTREASDAWARLDVRLAEIEQSIALLERLGAVDRPPPLVVPAELSGTVEASLETPRGRALLRLEVQRGAVTTLQLAAPSSAHLALVSGMCSGLELSDALLAIGSLDLSPWEIDP